uniref:Predicted protein n=1 Tax=Physcomitrium patens TaxID=3218 RepID=A9TZM7_PHYPA
MSEGSRTTAALPRKGGKINESRRVHCRNGATVSSTIAETLKKKKQQKKKGGIPAPPPALVPPAVARAKPPLVRGRCRDWELQSTDVPWKVPMSGRISGDPQPWYHRGALLTATWSQSPLKACSCGRRSRPRPRGTGGCRAVADVDFHWRTSFDTTRWCIALRQFVDQCWRRLTATPFDVQDIARRNDAYFDVVALPCSCSRKGCNYVKFGGKCRCACRCNCRNPLLINAWRITQCIFDPVGGIREHLAQTFEILGAFMRDRKIAITTANLALK